MKNKIAFNPILCNEEEIEGERDYEIMQLDLGPAVEYVGGIGRKIINASCDHCGVDFDEDIGFIGTMEKEGHKLRVSKQSMSFTCPAHGGWITTFKREQERGT